MTVAAAAKKLLEGELVVFPTETVYGLGALASNSRAVKKIFQVKGRPAKNPLILHIADTFELPKLVRTIPASAEKLMQHFWPGPLTICFQKKKGVSDIITAGLPTVCIRMPDHPKAHALLRKVREAVAAPSANLSGKPSTTTFKDAKAQLQKKGISFIDGGKTPLGLESTIIDCSKKIPRLLRHGFINKKAIEKVLQSPILDLQSSKKITSPGQLLAHYQPRGKLRVVYGKKRDRRKFLEKNIRNNTIVLGVLEDPKQFPELRKRLGAADLYCVSSKEKDLKTYSSRLYRFLNWCDRKNAKEIFLELPSFSHPLIPALLDRLKKASKGRILRV